MTVPPTAGGASRDHFCFGCGRRNTIGLHLDFARDGDEVVAHYEPRLEDQGFPGIMHGGLIALLLDEAMGWALYHDGVYAFTATMQTRYRRPVQTERAIEVRGRLVRERGRRIDVEAWLIDEGGERLAEASALLLRMSPEQQAAARATLSAAERAPGA